MRIGVDMDGVIFDWERAACNVFLLDRGPKLLSEGQKFSLSRIKERGATDWNELEGIVGEANWKWFWASAVHDYKVFAEGKPYPGAVGAMHELCVQHSVFILTSRNKKHAWQTYTWLGEREISPRGIIHSRRKVDMVKALELEAVIDDNQDQLAQLVRVPRLWVYMQERPWNRGFTTSYYRYRSVTDLSEYTDQLTNKEAA